VHAWRRAFLQALVEAPSDHAQPQLSHA
jgi:hypothetical protein